VVAVKHEPAGRVPVYLSQMRLSTGDLHHIDRLALPLVIRREIRCTVPLAVKCTTLNRPVVENA
jgi:hypothetical protein